MSTNWIQVKDLTPYIESGNWRNESDPNSPYREPLVERAYTEEGQLFPLFSLTIYSDEFRKCNPTTGIQVEANTKSAHNDGWKDCEDIPLQLVPDLQEMIQEALDKIKAEV
jgi:hypothetical protein